MVLIFHGVFDLKFDNEFLDLIKSLAKRFCCFIQIRCVCIRIFLQSFSNLFKLLVPLSYQSLIEIIKSSEIFLSLHQSTIYASSYLSSDKIFLALRIPILFPLIQHLIVVFVHPASLCLGDILKYHLSLSLTSFIGKGQ